MRVGDLIGGWDLCSIVREINRLRARFQANAGRRPLSEHIVYIGNPVPVELGPNRQGASRGVSKDPRPVLLDAQLARNAGFKQRPGAIVNSIMTYTMGDPCRAPPTPEQPSTAIRRSDQTANRCYNAEGLEK